MKELAGRTAILTGASRGIGVHIAKALAAKGVRVALAARGEEGLQTVRVAIEAAGGQALAVPTDVTKRADLERLVSETESAFGSVDLLVNNAGVERSMHFEDVSLDDLEQCIAINLTGVILLSRLVLPGMMARNRGHIVNMGSLAGLAPMAFGEGYGATKHGVVGFTRALRASLQCQGSAVSASVVCPGFVSETGMFADKQREYDVKPAMFLGTTGPEKVAQTVISSIQRDRAEVIVNRGPIRLSLGMSMWFPRLGEWLGHRLGVHQTSREAADRTRKALTEG